MASWEPRFSVPTCKQCRDNTRMHIKLWQIVMNCKTRHLLKYEYGTSYGRPFSRNAEESRRNHYISSKVYWKPQSYRLSYIYVEWPSKQWLMCICHEVNFQEHSKHSVWLSM